MADGAAAPLGALLVVLLARPDAEPARIEVGGGSIQLRVASPDELPPIAVLQSWVEHAGRAVALAFGRFPVARVRVDVVAGRPRGGGRTWCAADGPHVRVGVRRGADRAALADDWVLTHELVHLGFPDMPDDHGWMEEGLATYLEPVVRARTGQISAEKVWRDLVEGCPRGVPSRGAGLNSSQEWGPTYWGGATYWLLADVEIRSRTRGRRSLDHALRGILAAFPEGTCAAGDVDGVIAAGDRASGVAVLSELHVRLGERAFRPDLAGLWKRLGVVASPRGMDLDDSAPLADVRRAITAPAEAPTAVP
jgi:hypothetical protein